MDATAVHRRLFVQLSTYDVNDDNGQGDVKAAVTSGLRSAGLELLALVKTDGQMMSLVLGRACAHTLVEEIVELPRQFDAWLIRLRAGAFIEEQRDKRLHPTAASQRLPPLPPLPRGRRG